MLSLLSYPISNLVEDKWDRRDTGAAAVVKYCDVHEGGPLRGRPKRKASESATSAGPVNQPQDTSQTQYVANSAEAPVSVGAKLSHATNHIQ